MNPASCHWTIPRQPACGSAAHLTPSAFAARCLRCCLQSGKPASGFEPDHRHSLVPATTGNSHYSFTIFSLFACQCSSFFEERRLSRLSWWLPTLSAPRVPQNQEIQVICNLVSMNKNLLASNNSIRYILEKCKFLVPTSPMCLFLFHLFPISSSPSTNSIRYILESANSRNFLHHSL